MTPFVPLARRTLIYEWARFLPCAAAIAGALVLIAVQLALVLGIFASAAVYIDASDADLWMGFRGTQSIELGRPIPRDADLILRADPRVGRIEPFIWVSADWHGPAGRGEQSVFVSGIDPGSNGLIFARALAPDTRRLLFEPGTVIVDRADLDKLGVPVGAYGSINGKRVHLVAAVSGLRALGGVSLIASLDTAHALDVDNKTERPTYYVAQLRPGANIAEVRRDLAATAPRVVQMWTRDEFARRVVVYWLLETGAGLGVLFITIVVTLAASVIASQALRSALAPSLKEYATLRAFGVGASALRGLMLEKTLWLGGVATLTAALIVSVLISAAHYAQAPAVLSLTGMLACGGLLCVVLLAAALGAMRLVTQADPFALLR